MKYLESIFLYKGTRQKTSGIGKRLKKTSGIDSILAKAESNDLNSVNYFSQFTLIRVECEELFCKTNINLLKLIKINFVKHDDI